VEWVLTDIACHAYSLTVVALYDTLGEDASEFILNQTQSPIVVASIDHIPHLIQMKHKLPSLKIVVSMDDLNEGDLAGRSKGDLLGVWAKENGLQLFSFHEGIPSTDISLSVSGGPWNCFTPPTDSSDS
jgi:long-chain acyl-CoA synthetase